MTDGGGDNVELTVWSCNTCGPSFSSRGGWCDRGCGSDYNRMERVVLDVWGVIGTLASLYEAHLRFGRWWQPWPPHGLPDFGSTGDPDGA